MEKVKLGDKLEVSRIIQGFWRTKHLGLSDGELLDFMKGCIELGVDTFDTADIYLSEANQGRAMALESSLRDKIKIITKCGIKPQNELFPEVKTLQYNSTKEHIVKSVDNSLKRLGVEYIDLLLIHRPDFIMNPEEMAEAFLEIEKKGKVLNFGVSNFKPSQISMLQSYVSQKLITNQIEISPLKLEPFIDGSLDYCLEKRIKPMAWSPLAGGRIFKGESETANRVKSTLDRIKNEIGAKSIDEVAYGFLLKHPAKILPIVGSHKIQRVQSAINGLEINLTQDQWYEIWQSSLGRNID